MQRSVVAAAFAVVILLFAPVDGAAAQVAPACTRSGPANGAYRVDLCIVQPVAGTEIAGIAPVEASVTIEGDPASIQKLVFHLDGEYLLTDYEAPYQFDLPTETFAAGQHTLTVTAELRDGFSAQGAPVTVTIAGQTPAEPAPPFTPHTPDAPEGQPLLIAATGDGAGGETSAALVTAQIVAAEPDLFLYLGDVYDEGTYAEFYNWYGTPGRFFGQFRDITNPIIGNHEYGSGDGSGYFRYWNDIPHYYSYDAGGWHFVALDSTSEFGHRHPGSPQLDWLRQDLAAHADRCTIVYLHHPVFSVGPQGDNTDTIVGIWHLVAQYGVEMLLAGHDHSYQRWHPLDGDGQPSPRGVTQFVVGSGGHGIQPFSREDDRIAVGLDDPGNAIGALYLELNPQGANYRYVNVAGDVLDHGVIPCVSAPADTEPPSLPDALSAVNDKDGYVTLQWEPARDETGIASYIIYRDGVELSSVGGSHLTYVDKSAGLGVRRSYQVEAVDSLDNRSALSSAVAITRPQATTVRALPVADTYVSAETPDANYGTALTLRADAEPDTHSYLRFDLRDLSGTVERAVLRLYTGSSSGIGYGVAAVNGAEWDEKTIIYADAPRVDRLLGDAGPYAAGDWTEVDVTAAVAGGTELTLAVVAKNSTTLNLASRESEQPPELLIDVSARPSPLRAVLQYWSWRALE